jgi:hypothetical protein
MFSENVIVDFIEFPRDIRGLEFMKTQERLDDFHGIARDTLL